MSFYEHLKPATSGGTASDSSGDFTNQSQSRGSARSQDWQMLGVCRD